MSDRDCIFCEPVCFDPETGLGHAADCPTRYAYGRQVSLANDPRHTEGCEAQMIEKDGEEITGICSCVDGCPDLTAAIKRGQELAEEHGW